jgi:hypothetical protein
MQHSELQHSKYIDSRLDEAAAGIDWHAVSQEEAARFGLSLGLYRDVLQAHQKRYVAYGTAAGGVISMTVLVTAAQLVGASPLFGLAIVVTSQTFRAFWLWWKAKQSGRDADALGWDAVFTARNLALDHPVQP